MVEIDKYRIKFASGVQRKFLEEILDKERIDKLADVLSVSDRTIRDWRREKFLMKYSTAHLLSKKYTIKIPPKYELKNNFWYTTKGARKGGLASLKKQGGRIGGDQNVRLEKWREWWEKVGRFQKKVIFSHKPVQLPAKSILLAEFVGIMLGDGGISKNQVVVTLNRRTDRL